MIHFVQKRYFSLIFSFTREVKFTLLAAKVVFYIETLSVKEVVTFYIELSDQISVFWACFYFFRKMSRTGQILNIDSSCFTCHMCIFGNIFRKKFLVFQKSIYDTCFDSFFGPFLSLVITLLLFKMFSLRKRAFFSVNFTKFLPKISHFPKSTHNDGLFFKA